MASQDDDRRSGGPHYHISEDGWLIFPLRTADGRNWQVGVEPEALEGMADQQNLNRDAIDRVMLLHGSQLELAALRVIAKGVTEGETVIVTAASLRL